MKIRRIFSMLVFLGLLLLAGVVYYKIRSYLSNENFVVPPAPNIEGEAPLLVNNYKLKDTDGMTLNWTLDSDEARMYKNNGIIQFKVVSTFVSGSKKDKTSYIINSDEGTYYTKTGQVALRGNVVIKTSTGFSFFTDGVIYSSSDRNVKTNLRVVAKGPEGSDDPIYIEGVGLSGDFGSGDFKILKSVKTVKESHDEKNKLDVKSQRAWFNTSSNTAIFDGKVDAVKGNMTIKGDSLTVSYEKSGIMKSINVKNYVQINALSKSGKLRKAYCDNAVIDNMQGKVELTGRPEFHVDNDIMTGAKITFFTDSDKVYVENVKAEVSEEGIKSSE